MSLRGACCKHVFVQLWGLYLWKVSTAFLFRGIIGYYTVKVGDAGGNFADNMSLLLLKEGWSKQYAFCNVFFKASSDLLFFFFFFSYFFARWISVANACSSYTFPSTHLSFISVVSVTSPSLGNYPWSAWEGYSVINGDEPCPMESGKEEDHCSGWEQLLHVESLVCREMYSDTFPFAFAQLHSGLGNASEQPSDQSKK